MVHIPSAWQGPHVPIARVEPASPTVAEWVFCCVRCGDGDSLGSQKNCDKRFVLKLMLLHSKSVPHPPSPLQIAVLGWSSLRARATHDWQVCSQDCWPASRACAEFSQQVLQALSLWAPLCIPERRGL